MTDAVRPRFALRPSARTYLDIVETNKGSQSVPYVRFESVFITRRVLLLSRNAVMFFIFTKWSILHL